MKYLSIKLSKSALEELKKLIALVPESDDKNKYLLYSFQDDTMRISIYKNDKNDYFKAFLIGDLIEEFLPKISDYTLIKKGEMSTKQEQSSIDDNQAQHIFDQIGSDEVGTGDLLAPIIVCAALFRKKDYRLLKKYKITDSKKLSDEYILAIGGDLAKHFRYSIAVLSNEKYNSLITKGYNMVQIKTLLHNKVLSDLKETHQDVKSIYIDQFVNEKKYYSYLQNEKRVLRGITFKTKAESLYPSVAIASIIARFTLLKQNERLEKELGLEISLGSGPSADFSLLRIYDLLGENGVLKYAKNNFNNIRRIMPSNDK